MENTKINQNMSKPLLVVFPGREGRQPVLQKVLENSSLACVLPGSGISDWAKEYSVKNFVVTDTMKFEEILQLVTEGKADILNLFSGVLCYDEFGLELAYYLCEELGVPGTPYDTVQKFRNKFEFRRHSEESGVPVPKYCKILDYKDALSDGTDGTFAVTSPVSNCQKLLAIPTDQKPHVKKFFPGVIKPVKGAGAWNVHSANTLVEFNKLVPSLQDSFQDSPFPDEIKQGGLFLESKVQGDEIDVDGFAINGIPAFWCVCFNKEVDSVYFQEQGGVYPAGSNLTEAQMAAVAETVKNVFKSFPKVHGCFHFEAIVSRETAPRRMSLNFFNWRKRVEAPICVPIEMNLRVGGAECPSSVFASTGVNLVAAAIKLALNSGADIQLRELEDLEMKLVQQEIFFHPDLDFNSFLSVDTPRFPFVVSNNLYPEKEGTLVKLKMEEESVQEEMKNVVQMVLFESSLGRVIEAHNGSMSCVGWIAVGGETMEEAGKILAKVTKALRIEIV
eukprot:maker-scaffold_5-snap-gene-20.6-mRNA-1 protein AED:0.00 eAED:0.00 QI:154/1/1/1/1/1/2/76/503